MNILSKTQVPMSLQEGAFFEALDPNDDVKFAVPFNHLKPDPRINSEKDLHLVLTTLRFWMVFDMPLEITHYVMKNTSSTAFLASLLPEFPEFHSFLSSMIALQASSPHRTVFFAIPRKLGVQVAKLLNVELELPLQPACWDAAVQSDDIPTLIYLQLNGIPCHISVAFMAAEFGSVKCIKYAKNQGWIVDDGSLDIAAYGGHNECVQFLREVCGKKFTPQTMKLAAAGGDLTLIKYLHKAGCAWSAEVCVQLALRGKLDCLEYAHKNGCPWDKRTCAAAAQTGHLDCLEYAHGNNCPWDKRTTSLAGHNNHEQCLAYALNRGCPDRNAIKATQHIFSVAYFVIVHILGALFAIYDQNVNDTLYQIWKAPFSMLWWGTDDEQKVRTALVLWSCCLFLAMFCMVNCVAILISFVFSHAGFTQRSDFLIGTYLPIVVGASFYAYNYLLA